VKDDETGEPCIQQAKQIRVHATLERGRAYAPRVSVSAAFLR
jgi:hypothetical protein